MHTVTDTDLSLGIIRCMDAQPRQGSTSPDAKLLCDVLGRMISRKATILDDVTDTELETMKRWLPDEASRTDSA